MSRELLGAGREAEIFAWEPGRVLRLARDPAHGPALERERVALEAAAACGAPAPGVHERVDVDGRPGLVLDRVDGEDLLTVLAQRPWRVLKAGEAMGRVQAAIHDIEAPGPLPDLREHVRFRLGSDLVPDDVREVALQRLADLPDGDRLCHCDFHPANLLAEGDRHVLIDWTGASRGDPAADVARTRLILRHGQVPPGTRAPAAALIRVGRRVLLGDWLREYRRRRPLDLEAVDRWTPVLAAARLGEDIAGERETMLRLAHRRQARPPR